MQEMTGNLGREKHEKNAERPSQNIRNGTTSKTVLTNSVGPVEIEVPRDRAGTFEPVIAWKRQRRLNSAREVVLSLYAKGLLGFGGWLQHLVLWRCCVVVLKYDSARLTRLWQFWRMGKNFHEIADSVGLSVSVVKSVIYASGGIEPDHKHTPRYLSAEDRVHIGRWLAEKLSYREIGRRLGRSASTIQREVKRNSSDGSGYRSRYIATAAQRQAFIRGRRPKPLKIQPGTELYSRVEEGLVNKLSPEQVAGRLKRDFPDRPELHVSHESIYRAFYLYAGGELKKAIKGQLRSARKIRYPNARTTTKGRVRLKGGASIHDRPEEVKERIIPGHWEGDLIVGKDGNSSIGTVVERVSGYLLLVWMDPTMNRIEALTRELTRKLAGLPDQLRHTLTWDQGSEMAEHQIIANATNIDVYFADPSSPWQRGSNENTNGLLRQYFPKGTDLQIHSPQDLAFVQDELNNRPRKRLQYATPYETLAPTLLQQP